jgi:hypothetical protein
MFDGRRSTVPHRLLLIALLLSSAAWAAETPQIAVVHLDRPIWLLGLGDARWLFEFRAQANGANVSVFPLANVSPSDLKEPTQQREDEIGRATRSLALFLSERIFVETTCRSSAEVPVVRGVGPVVSGKEWPVETLVTASKEASPAIIISGAVERRYAGARSRVTIAVWDAATRKLEVSLEDVRYFEQPNSSALALTERVIQHLVRSSRCERLHARSGWDRPPEVLVGRYLDALGQLLPQSLAENGVVPASSIWGEADMLAWYATLRQRMPSSVPAELIYVRGILMSKAYGGSAYSQFQSDLVSQASMVMHPPNEVTRLAPLIFARLGEHERCKSSKLVLSKGADESFAGWLGRVQCE